MLTRTKTTDRQSISIGSLLLLWLWLIATTICNTQVRCFAKEANVHAIELPQHRIDGHRHPILEEFYSRARNYVADYSRRMEEQFDAIKVKTFKVFMQVYNKTYSAREFPKRFGLFLKRHKLIARSISLFREGKSSFSLRENTFLDWYQSELKHLAGVKAPQTLEDLFPEERATLLAAGKRRRQTFSNHYNGQQQASGWHPPATNYPDYKNYRHKRDLTNQVDDGDSLNFIEFQQQDQRPPAGADIRKRHIPAQMDWRRTGCIAEPMNQLQCGACYAMATMSVIESMHCINRTPGATTLAPQQLVDCSIYYKNHGCEGGWPTGALKYLQDVNLVARDHCYPFEWQQNQCSLGQVYQVNSNECFVAANSIGQQKLRFKILTNERDILYYVGTTGPVVSVMNTTDNFLYYGSGIFDDPQCSRQPEDVDHAIVIVGYGREQNQDYWLIKNSWGADSWGEGGYAKVRRGSNACSIGHWAWVVLN